MASRIIHFGADDCHRMLVLESAGYAVVRCHSVPLLREYLQLGEDHDAILIGDGQSRSSRETLGLIKSYTAAPVILFRAGDFDPLQFDLVIESLTPPDVWLRQIQLLIARDSAERADAVHRQSAELQRQMSLTKMAGVKPQRDLTERLRGHTGVWMRPDNLSPE